jgi:hypothetical protein
MGVVPNKLRPQVFWEGTGELAGWYSYVNRSAHLFGHVMQAFGGSSDLRYASRGLSARFPELHIGGFLYYLGSREHMTEYKEIGYRKASGKDEIEKHLLRHSGMPSLVNQFRRITRYNGDSK